MKIKLWDSGREELRKLPIICPFCEHEVQISGNIEDGELKWDDCPHCKAMITGAFYSDDEEEPVPGVAKYPVSAEVKWMVEGAVESERTSKIGGSTLSIYSPSAILFHVLMAGAEYYQGAEMSASYILFLLVGHLIGVLPSHYMVELLGLCDERIVAAEAQAVKEVMEDED